jgi:ElaB/YqjD/DUF883 family membrane-anchored ribosome-binding protein
MPHTRDHDNIVDDSPLAKQSSDLMHDARDLARRQADAGMDRASETARGFADTLHRRAENFEGVRADANERVAETIDRTADYLKEHDSEQLFGDVKSYIRKHPMQAVAGAVVGGMLLGKFFL